MDIYYQPTIQSQTYSDETDRTKLHHPVPTETQSGKLHYDEAIDRSVNATFDSVTNNLTETLDVNHNITTLDNNRFSYQTIGYNVPIIPLSVSANKYSNYSRIGFSESNKSLLRPKTIAVDFSTKGGKLYRGFDETRSSSEFGSYSRPTAVEQSCTTLGPTHITLWEMMYLTSFNFPYGLICGTMGLFVLPAEAQRLFPATESIMLGVSLGIVGVSQLVCPVAGNISDRMPGKVAVSRRCPFILTASICAGLSVLGMWGASHFMLGLLYYIFLFFGMVALNVIYSVQCGLVPDLCTPEIEGRASGVVAVNTITGSATGFIMMMATNHMDFHYAYPIYFILVGISGFLSLTTAYRLQYRTKHEAYIPLVPPEQEGRNAEASETPTPGSEYEVDNQVLYRRNMNAGLQILGQQIELTERRQRRRLCLLTWREVLDCYKMDLSHGYDFFWVFLGRTFYYVAVSCQAFMLYYLRDVIGTTDSDTRRLQLGAIALSAQALAASVAYPIGRWSDSDSVDKKSLIYAAAALMATTYGCFMIAPVFGPNAFWFVIATALIYGLGNGCFLAVDYALALATLPSKENSAQALGIWGVSAFLGSAIGPMLWGLLIDVLGSSPSLPEGEYLYRGYFAMLCGGISVTILAGWIITFVKKTV